MEPSWPQSEIVLRLVDQHLLQRAAQAPVFLGRYYEVLSSFDTYLEHTAPRMGAQDMGAGDLVAYFCAEYGLHESVRIYSGGLGVLAGEHCKTASDLRLPFVAVGLLYRAGYFSQQIDAEGRQVAQFMESPLDHLPIKAVLRDDGAPVTAAVLISSRHVQARVWEMQAGMYASFCSTPRY